MNVRLHIERIVVDGPAVVQNRGDFAQSLQSQLECLIREGGLAPELLAGGTTDELTSGRVVPWSTGGPASPAESLADAIYKGIGPSEP